MARSILHMLTPLRHMSPFDVNMAVDAGFETVVTYTEVSLADVVSLTQDSIFSRSPADGTRTGIFIGGKNAEDALDMVDRAKKAFVPPFVNHVFADPAGSFTTGAAMVAQVSRALRQKFSTDLTGKRIVIFGGAGVVAYVAAVIGALQGATTVLVGHDGEERVSKIAFTMKWRFGIEVGAVDGTTPDDRRAAIRDADSTAAPLIGHNLFWETEILYVSDKGDSVNIQKATRDTLNFASAGVTMPSFVTNIPDVRTLRFRGDTLSLADLNTRIPSFVKNNPDTLFRYQVGVGYQYQIEVDGFASQYGFKALTLPTGAALDSVSNIPRLILWNPTLNDTITHPISIEITPPSGAIDTLSYNLDIFTTQSFPDTTGFLAVRDSTSRFIGMVKETSTIEVPHTAGENYNFTIGVTGNRSQYFFNSQILPTGVSSTKVSEEGIIDWATTLADTGSSER